MRFLLATDNGNLSYVRAAKGSDAFDKNAPPAEITTIYTSTNGKSIHCIASLSFPSPTRGDVEAVAVACQDGTVLIMDAENGEKLAMIEASDRKHDLTSEEEEMRNDVVSLEIQHGYIACCTAAGLARFTKVSSLWSDAVVTYETILPAPVSVMRMHPDFAGTIAFGGKENDLQIWSTNTETEGSPFQNLAVKWSARNVKNDKLDLRVPIWITDLQFLPSPSEEAYRLVTSTHYKQLRLYATEQARRPVSSSELSEHPIVRLVSVTKDNADARVNVVFSDAIGNVLQADVSKSVITGGYKGASGAVGALALSEDRQVVATGGMDSYLRAFEVHNHRQILSVYARSRIDHVLILADDTEIKEEESQADEDEDVWDGLEEVEEPRSKKVRTA